MELTGRRRHAERNKSITEGSSSERRRYVASDEEIDVEESSAGGGGVCSGWRACERPETFRKAGAARDILGKSAALTPRPRDSSGAEGSEVLVRKFCQHVG